MSAPSTPTSPTAAVAAEANTPEVICLRLADIRTDDSLQTRVEIDADKVGEFFDDMKLSGISGFPPLDVFLDDGTYRLVDGFHRFLAAARLRITEFPCRIHLGGKDEASWFGCGCNAKHGWRRSQADRERAIRRALLLHHDMSDSALGRQVHVDGKTIARYRIEMIATSEIPKSTRRKGKDGRTINTSPIGCGSKKQGSSQQADDEKRRDDDGDEDRAVSLVGRLHPAAASEPDRNVEGAAETDVAEKPVATDDVRPIQDGGTPANRESDENGAAVTTVALASAKLASARPHVDAIASQSGGWPEVEEWIGERIRVEGGEQVWMQLRGILDRLFPGSQRLRPIGESDKPEKLGEPPSRGLSDDEWVAMPMD